MSLDYCVTYVPGPCPVPSKERGLGKPLANRALFTPIHSALTSRSAIIFAANPTTAATAGRLLWPFVLALSCARDVAPRLDDPLYLWPGLTHRLPARISPAPAWTCWSTEPDYCSKR